MSIPPLPAEELRRLLGYDPETGIFIRLVRTANTIRVGDIAGYVNKAGYRLISVNGAEHNASRLAWFYMTGEWPQRQVDHKNRNKSDNRWANLRIASASQNIANSGLHSKNKVGLKGVSRRKTGQYEAGICVNYRQIHLGLFNCPAAAHFAYVIAAEQNFGEFARAR